MWTKTVFTKTAVIALTGILLICSSAAGAELYDQQELLNVRIDRVNQLLRAGRLNDAMQQARKALATAVGIYGANSAGTAPAIDRIAATYRAMGQLQEAETHLVRALELVKKDLGENHPRTVPALNNLAGLYREMGHYAAAEKLYLQALDNLKKRGEHAPEAESDLLGNLAVLYITNTRYADAEPLLKRVLKMAEKAAERDWLTERMKISTDPQQIEAGRRMHNLANLYFKMKRYSDSEKLTARALEIFRRILGEEHPETARLKSDLGVLYTATGQYDKAEALLTGALNSALAIYAGKPHPAVAEYYTSLADLYQKSGNNDAALRFAGHSLKMLLSTLGKNNPKTLRCLNNIAVIHINLGNLKQAEEILRDVLATARGLMGERHESLSVNLSNLGSVLAGQGKHAEASRMFSEAIAINEQKRESAFLILSEQQKLNYIESMQQQVRLYLSHLAQHGPFDSRAVKTAMDTWLRWKGAVLEAQGRYVDALYRSDNPLLQQRFDELAQVRRELAGMQLFMGRDSNTGQLQHRTEALEKRKQTLEAELSGLSSRFAQERLSGRVDSDSLARALPQDAVYIDYAVIDMADFGRQLSQKPRYAAFVLLPGSGQISLIDIADQEELDGMVRSYLAEMKRKAEGSTTHDPKLLEQHARRIYNTAIKPLLPVFKGRNKLYVSPDGALNLIPFEVLPADDSRYLVEQFRINYAASGRDILRHIAAAASAKGPAVIVSDPDFDADMVPPADPGSAATLPGGAAGSVFRSVRFERLPDTRQEADAIVRLLKSTDIQVNSFYGKEADEQALFAIRNPRILHLATHGYFLSGGVSSSSATRGLKVSMKTDDNLESGRMIENPMLRSGIVLAGANSSLRRGSDRGLVSAEKILGLRLHNTDLVTLSACETAAGDVRAGEGVFGLKRAFLLSGARTLVMSLWSVPSVETTELMTAFYTFMHNGMPKGEALRQARLEMMKKKRHPFYWGAFIMVGRPD